MSQQDRKFVGRGKKIGQYGMIAVNICISDLEEHAEEFKGKKYVKLMVGEMRSADEKGRTHNVWIDEWKPDPNRAPRAENGAPHPLAGEFDPKPEDEQINPEDIPF